jgi:two-component system NtrC family sensor kinase
MKTKTLLLALFITLKSLGQDSLPPVYEIKADTAISVIGKQYWQMLEDTAGKLSIQDVRRPEIAKKFHGDNTEFTGMGFLGLKDYWIRFRLKNTTGKDQGLVFPVISIRSDYYIFRVNGVLDHLKSGWGVKFNDKDTFNNSNNILVRIRQNEEIIIYKKNHYFAGEMYKRPSLVGFRFYDQYIRDVFFNSQANDNNRLLEAFMAGFLFLAFLLTLFFYRIVKEKIYLYYALFVLSEGYWIWSLASNMLTRNTPLPGWYIDVIFSDMLGYVFFVLFTREFLKTKAYFPRWDRLLLIITAVLVITVGSQYFFDSIISIAWYKVASLVVDIVFFLLMAAITISFFLPGKESLPYRRLSIIAIFPISLYWTCSYTLGNLYRDLNFRYDVPIPEFVVKLRTHSLSFEMICVAWFSILFTWILLQKYALIRKQLTMQALEREKERTELMEIKNDELEKKVQLRTAELKQSIDDLKNTQQQLIQSEKMASLGELTAGIAHEIQNPLNFVNNFSEVNKELIVEMKEEISKGNLEEVKTIAKNIESNEEKINHHGKRADAIVKGMLQHSRNSSGTKEPTNINALADEYLRLAYHGLRAKDKSFNATMATNYDESIGTIHVMPQDIGRVILNLITNAFYAVNEKKKAGAAGYEPTVTINTARENNRVIISVKDNGNGVPQKIADKIFQPFFTTKPTGEGTGLGLSLSYDIVKAHGGELTMQTTEGAGTTFFIRLP